MLAIFLAPVYILLNIYVIRWIFLWTGRCLPALRSIAFRIPFAIVYVLIATSLLSGFLLNKPIFLHRILKVTGNYFLGIFLYSFIVILIADIIRLILKHICHVSWIGSPRALVVGGTLCFVLIAGICISGIYHAHHLSVNHYEASIEKEVPGMENLKIVLISDTHFGYNAGAKKAQKMVDKINEQNPDIVLVAGDIFDNEYDAIRDPDTVAEILSTIESKYGVYACWGNHDLNEPILAGFTFRHDSLDEILDERMSEFLEKSNIKMLEDEAELIDNAFYVVGRKDASLIEKVGETRKTPEELTADLDKTKPIIIIDHQPKELQEIADAGVDLDLCGHTHDGQTFPGNIVVSKMWENSCGFLKKDNMTNIVSSGAGVWGPAIRFGTNSEICAVDMSFI